MNLKQKSDIVAEMLARQKKGHPFYYWPFPKEESAVLRAYHAATIPVIAIPLLTRGGFWLASNYTRVVIGDYGAYVEIAPNQISGKLVAKFPVQLRRVKYEWLYPPGEPLVKIYKQVQTVAYADYLVGFYYVSPFDLKNALDKGSD